MNEHGSDYMSDEKIEKYNTILSIDLEYKMFNKRIPKNEMLEGLKEQYEEDIIKEYFIKNKITFNLSNIYIFEDKSIKLLHKKIRYYIKYYGKRVTLLKLLGYEYMDLVNYVIMPRVIGMIQLDLAAEKINN